MALRRLDDAELGRRVRARNARANEAHRLRLANAGKRQTSVWLSADLRERLDTESAATGAALSQIVEQLLGDGLNYRQQSATPISPMVNNTLASAQTAPESLPLFEPPLTCINADLNSLIEGGSVKVGPVHTDADAFNQDLNAAGTEPTTTGREKENPPPVEALPTTADRDAAIMQLHKEGLSLAAIGQRLLDRGIATTNGTAISKTTIARTLKNAGLRANGVAPGR